MAAVAELVVRTPYEQALDRADAALVHVSNQGLSEPQLRIARWRVGGPALFAVEALVAAANT